MASRRVNNRWKIVEAALWTSGAALLLFGCVTLTQASLAQQEGRELVDSLPRTVVGQEHAAKRRVEGAIEAELEIPAIQLSVPVLTGCTEETLRRGACRLLGTAVAGGLGNMALAGHRDTSFRPLERLHAGDVARVVDASGRYEYIVNRTEVVSPDDVRVLDVGDRPELTLITCFPFHYVGAAPKRYIVHAYLRSVDGSVR